MAEQQKETNHKRREETRGGRSQEAVRQNMGGEAKREGGGKT
jgi:hypothetical protein